MRPTIAFALVPCLAALAAAQEVDLTVKPQKDPVRVGITSSVSSKAETEILMNGEPMDFGGRGGGGRGGRGGGMSGPRESSTTQTVEFDDGDGWRQYHKVEAVVETTGRDGELVENEVAGALAGKKVALQQDEEGNLVLVEGEGEDAQELNRMMARGIHLIDMSSLLPGKSIEVGGTYELGNFGEALQGLMHPVVPQMPEGFGGRGGRRGGGQGGGDQGGGDQGGGDQGGRGGRGARGGQQGGGAGGRMGGGFAGRMGGASNPLDSILAAENLEWKGTGKLVSFEGGVAVVEIEAKVGGEGTNEELGLPAGMMGMFGGGRGGRGGRGGQGAGGGGESHAAIALTWKGKLEFDADAGMIKSLVLEGALDDKRTSKREMNRGGETSELETKSKTDAKVRLQVACKHAE